MAIKEKIHHHAYKIIKTLHENGFEAYLVGGAVRDLLLDTIPKDYDISTSATPEEIKKVFKRDATIIGRRFRLVHVRIGPEVYEVSTFRRKPDEKERLGRTTDSGLMIWSDNEYGTMEEDAFRRDFSVNALFYDPQTGTIQDPVGGKADMDAQLVRAIGDPEERILEDPVRMIRAIKLKAQYGFEIEEELNQVMLKHADKIALSSKSRLLEEIFKIMNKCYSAKTFRLLKQYNLLKYLLPAVDLAFDHQAGEVILKMLAARDKRKVSQKFYSDSRVLALGTLVLPFVQQLSANFSESSSPKGENSLWSFANGLEAIIRHAVFDCFGGVSLPRFLRTRLNSMLGAMPRFESNKRRTMLLQHKEYRYARELYLLWIIANDLNPKRLDEWPISSRPEAHFTGKSHPKRRRRRTRNHNK